MDRILLGSHKHPVNVETLLERTAEFLRADPPSFNHNFRSLLSPEHRNRTWNFFCLAIIIFASGMNPYLLSERWGGSTFCICHFTTYLLESHPLNLPQTCLCGFRVEHPPNTMLSLVTLPRNIFFSYRYKEAIKKPQKTNYFSFPVTPGHPPHLEVHITFTITPVW